ncbi:hypothetical protein PISMIDRAFT_101701 [Pisolithus microcarpus 441]|uniref:CxC1-like cysteine cluster associated with KDZ transposases domain-containing protein n=1 Tax=Pisolithus microcarpus 441 TaxID=765257 RepID=A0A0C9ZK93_9AGAM|nr:hypothetical protein PISMIDRAFT_101701 [Pisolithus microcarpus 441]
MRQWQRWSSTTIPSLIEPYLAYWRLSGNFWDVVNYELPQCNCQSSRQLKVLCIQFNGSKTVDLMVCPCVPTAVQLLQMGFFPCAPLGPTLAISLPVLSLVRQLFMCMPLNISAWSESLEAYLGGMGYEVDTKVLHVACILYYDHTFLFLSVHCCPITCLSFMWPMHPF